MLELTNKNYSYNDRNKLYRDLAKLKKKLDWIKLDYVTLKYKLL